jgi:prepilin-type N-terminal cleavage/methylation domain-containing protein/prepilin-type processing-associated H-X9-DG protein
MIRSRRARGFTLIELLVAIGIVSVLLGLLLPAVQAAREAARKATCAYNMKQVALGMHNYLSCVGSFPAGYVSRVVASLSSDGTLGDDGGPGWSGHTMLLPVLEQSAVYNGINIVLGVDRVENRTADVTTLALFLCPSDGRRTPLVPVPSSRDGGALLCVMASSNYVMSVGTVRPTCRRCRDQYDGVFGRNTSTGPADITDGLSQTFGGGERAWKSSSATVYGVAPFSKILDNSQPGKFALGPAYVLGTTFKEGFNIEPEALDDAADETNTFAEAFSSLHPGGAHFWFCDGSVRFLSDSTDIRLLWDYATRSGDPKGAKIHW